MKEKVRIHKPIERAIIDSFGADPDRKLVASEIKAFEKNIQNLVIIKHRRN